VTQGRLRDPRALLAVCVGLAGSAALLWGASATVWFRIAGLPGRPATESTGVEVAPSLTGFALLVLAAVAALVATAGPVRRIVAALLVLVGVVVGVVVVQAALVPPAAAGVTTRTAAPLLAVAGAVVLLAVSLFVLLREPRLPRLGARYAAPGARRVEMDPDRAAWQALDAGTDPTADVPGSRGDDPDVGGRTGPG
jgi:hypothetical protein